MKVILILYMKWKDLRSQDETIVYFELHNLDNNMKNRCYL